MEYLNKSIEENVIKGKYFLGIFHTHAEEWASLSNEDIEYINVIMDVMPMKVKYLYFPIVFPGKNIKSFKAMRKKEGVMITLEKTIII